MSFLLPNAPMPTTQEVHELSLFLAANADVARADGKPDKVAKFEQFQSTLRGLCQRAEDLSAVTRVDIVSDAKLQVLHGRDLFDAGCTLEVQDAGRTLKILPLPDRATV